QRTKRDPDSNIEKVLDLGFVGEPYAIDAGFLETFVRSDIIPVIAPIGVGDEGETYNINADTVAGAVAAALRAARLLLLTDVPGLDHVGLRVADLERAIHFYRDILGCPIEKVQEDIGLWQLRAGDALIDLVTLDGKLGSAGGAGPGAEGHNLNHFCLRLAHW